MFSNTKWQERVHILGINVQEVHYNDDCISSIPIAFPIHINMYVRLYFMYTIFADTLFN